jgi:maltooligosyltrehalose trehalohydrolase
VISLLATASGRSRLGATHLGDGRTAFLVWAPHAERVELLLGDGRELAMEPPDDTRHVGRGYFAAEVDDAPPGTRYRYRLHGAGEEEPLERPDPASRYQPDGVHGDSAVVDHAFAWSEHAWHGLPLADLVVYELHIGTFTSEGTFAGAVDRLDGLVELGVNAVEVMPIAEFPGGRNWGYDGVAPFAAQSTYGGPDGFRSFVDACHQRGLAVILDVVYNHFGPEGAYQADFGDYFTEKYSTPWGPAMNFDEPGSDEVRRYFLENALWWTHDCRVDGLRLDAVHAIYDQSAVHFLTELAQQVHGRAAEDNREVVLIAESDLNDPRLIRPEAIGGYGLDAQWVDDFHHALHAALTEEGDGYYADFGRVADVATAVRQGYVLTGEYSRYRRRRHGAAPVGVGPERFVVCAQNHDQVGNRMEGERLTALLPTEALKVAAACVLLSPCVPMLFMGEEYGERAPFLYFVSHGDPELVDAVREGRAEEFAAFAWEGEPPDPQAEETFARSTLRHERKAAGEHAHLFAWHRELLTLRRSHPALRSLDRDRIETVVDEDDRTLIWQRWTGLMGDRVPGTAATHRAGPREAVIVAVSFDPAEPGVFELPAGRWRRVVDSAEEVFGGPGSDAPEQVESEASTPVELHPHGVLVYVAA